MATNNIKAERARLEMSQKDLAQAMGVSATTIVNWESDIGQMSIKNLLAMSNIFGCSADYLIGRTEVRRSL